MNQKLPGIIIIFSVVAFGGYSLWQYGIEAATTIGSDAPSFQADLKNTLDLQSGVGKPTFTRATTATVTDFEGLIKNVKSGEARFEGARRVENLLVFTENFSSASWAVNHTGTAVDGIKTNNYGIAPDGTQTAARIQLDVSGGSTGDTSQVYNNPPPNFKGSGVHSVYIKTNDGSTKTIALSAIGQAITVNGTWRRISYSFNASSIFYFQLILRKGITSDSGDFLVWHPQSEDVTGQANQNPSEYVSTNVLTAAPYHGANVDGVKYFTTQNGNTVASNVVTEAAGAAIPDATLHGYVAEGARTNLALYSNAFTTVPWTIQTNTSATAAQGVAADGTMTLWSLTRTVTTEAKYFVRSGPTTVTNATHTVSAVVKKGSMNWVYLKDVGAIFTAYFDINNGVVGSITGTATSNIKALGNNLYLISATYTTGGVSTNIDIGFTSQDANTTCALGSAGDGIFISWFQLELGSFASSYIPTTSATVTRNADVLTYPMAGNFSDTAGSAYAEVMNVKTDTTYTVILHGASPLGGVMALQSNSNHSLYVYDGVAERAFSLNSSFPLTSMVKFATNWQGAVAKGAKNGTIGTTATFDGDMGVGGSMYIGHYTGSSTYDLFGTIRNVKIWKKALTDTQLQNLTSTNSAVSQSAIKKSTVKRTGTATTTVNASQNTKLTGGLVGLWSFNGPDVTDTAVYDRSGQGNNGYFIGGATSSAKTIGKVGQALSFDGVNDSVLIPDADSLDMSDPITIAFWVKPGSSQVANADILSKHAGSAAGYAIEQSVANTNKFYFAWGNGTSYTCVMLADTITLTANVWQHVAYVKNGATVTQYIDGQNVDSCTGAFSTIAPNDNAVYVSRFSSGGGRNFNGKIDEVRIYNRALSATEVSALYNLGR